MYTDKEKVDCRKEILMTAFVRVRAETQPDWTGAVETPAVCIGVPEMPSVRPRWK